MQQLKFPKLPLKRKMIYNLHSFLQFAKIDDILLHTTQPEGTIILMYHSVASKMAARWIDPSNHIPLDDFKKHMKFLANKRNVISMDSLIISLKEKKSLPAGSTVITFDDGYLDNMIDAAPILKEYNLPATIYLATGYIRRGENQWIDQLYSYFNNRTKNKLIIPEIYENQMEIIDSDSLWNAYSLISKYLILSSYKKRKQILNSIEKQLVPHCLPPRLTMNWNDVRTLINNYKNITLGSHTSDHMDISKLSDEELIFEIKTSTDEIEEETGQVPVHFSCPYSRSAKNIEIILSKLQYLSSVSDSKNLLITSESDSYCLGRVAAPAALSRLAHYTSGNYPKISQLIMRGRY